MHPWSDLQPQWVQCMGRAPSVLHRSLYRVASPGGREVRVPGASFIRALIPVMRDPALCLVLVNFLSLPRRNTQCSGSKAE